MNKRIISTILATTLLFTILSVLCLGTSAAGTLLSGGKKYTVVYEAPIENAFPKKAYQEENKLTDGAIAKKATYNEPEFLILYRGISVDVTIDLEKVCAVSSVDVHYLQHKDAGIYAPRYLRVAVSEDGEKFGTVGVLDDPNTITTAGASLVNRTVSLDGSYKARYVRVTICSDCNLYCDEVSVYGSESADGAKSAKADEPFAERGYADKLDGIGNVVLMYTVGNYKSEVLKPFLAYTENGEVKDKMFDAMLFLPSGASNFDYSSDAGWQQYLDGLFGKDGVSNLAGLEQAFGEVKTQAGYAADAKYPVFIALPDFTDEIRTSKTIYGVRPNSLDNRTAVIKGFVDEVLARFETANYKNVALKGFYWHEETVRYSVTNYEEQLIKNFNDYVHEKGYKSIWIPYYCAPGCERAVDLGFDCATLQSGYAFARNNKETGEIQPGSVSDSAGIAKKYGLGMEFELDTGVDDYLSRYLQYLTVGYRTGCMTDHMMMLYHGTMGLYNCAAATAGSEMRQVYDLTYQYIKGTFTSVPPVIEPGQVIVTESGKRASGNLIIIDEDSKKASFRMVKKEYSEGLTCVVENDGFYLINTSDTVPGVYTVTVQVSDGNNLSEEETVYVLVKDKEKTFTPFTTDKDIALFERITDTSSSSSLAKGQSVTGYWQLGDAWYYIETADQKGFVKADEIATLLPEDPEESEAESKEQGKDGEENGLPIGAIIGIAAGALVLIAAAVCIILKKKKK